MSGGAGDGEAHRAETLFAEWLARGGGGAGELEVLCRAHPHAAERLRELEREREQFDALRPQLGLADSLAARLSLRFGPEVDPRVELEREEEADFPTRVVERLAERAVSTRYRLKGTVAEGGMGAILRVWDEDLRRHLAMKVVLGRRIAPSEETPQVDPRQLARFLEEAQVTGQLDHPGIVPVHELGLDATGRAYFTMKLVRGRDLKAVFELVRTGADGWSQVKALGVLLKVCEAMSYAHDKGVIHRDLKPANVMVGRYGEVYVMDWGLARILGREDAKDIRLRAPDSSAVSAVRSDRRETASDTPDSPLVTMDGDVVGTPAYMAPEQANGDLDAMGPHSDVYALGAMLYHLLAGHMPYVRQGERASNYTVLRWVKDGPPHTLSTEAHQAPAELVAIADKAMARDAHARYTDMPALARDLSAFLEGRVVAAYETGTWAEARKWIRRNRALAASLAVAVLILVVGIAAISVYARKETAARILAQDLRDQALDRERELRVRGLIQDLAAFDAASRSFEYAERQSEPSSVWWPRWAKRLLHGEEEDPERGLQWLPGLAEAERRLEELRGRAAPYTAADAEMDRATHPRAAELESKRAELRWRRRMLDLESWPDPAQVEAGLSNELLAGELNGEAWRRVDPDAPIHGEESRALILASREAERAVDEDRHMVLNTLAWALYRRGEFDEARATMARAVESAPAEKRDNAEGYQRRLEEEIASWRDGRARAALESLPAEIAALEALVSDRRTWRFAESEDEWWHLQLAALVEDLHRLEGRLDFVERSVATSEAQARWREAIAAIETSEHYGGLTLTPQIGLLPIGPDPQSGLWEFAHLQTGEPPERGANGKLVLTQDTGLVFVLLPGGRFWMGAQSTDPEGRNYDPQAEFDESPVDEVELSPFFLSKYEMAQGPWRRTATWAPPRWEGEDALEPAHSVSWDDCMAALARADAWITLCTGAQWEYACRAGTDTPWWTGSDAESLSGMENVDIGHGQTVTLPIGQFAANPFGIHEMHGNLWEWCLDRAEDPWGRANDARLLRDSGHWMNPEHTRASARSSDTTTIRFDGHGVRPARRVVP